MVIEPVMLAEELRDGEAVAVELVLAVSEDVGLCKAPCGSGERSGRGSRVP